MWLDEAFEHEDARPSIQARYKETSKCKCIETNMHEYMAVILALYLIQTKS